MNWFPQNDKTTNELGLSPTNEFSLSMKRRWHVCKMVTLYEEEKEKLLLSIQWMNEWGDDLL